MITEITTPFVERKADLADLAGFFGVAYFICYLVDKHNRRSK